MARTPEDNIRNLIETAELMIEESVHDLAEIRDIGFLSSSRLSTRGADYDRGYAQGRKEACRVLLLSFDYTSKITSDTNADGTERL